MRSSKIWVELFVLGYHVSTCHNSR